MDIDVNVKNSFFGYFLILSFWFFYFLNVWIGKKKKWTMEIKKFFNHFIFWILNWEKKNRINYFLFLLFWSLFFSFLFVRYFKFLNFSTNQFLWKKQFRAPDGRVLFNQERQVDGTTSFVVTSEGLHNFCFSNAFSTVTAKVVNMVVNYEKVWREK